MGSLTLISSVNSSADSKLIAGFLLSLRTVGSIVLDDFLLRVFIEDDYSADEFSSSNEP